jgi:hypothetical protein
MQPTQEQPRRYCLHCLEDIHGTPVVVREKISLPSLPNVYTTRYLHQECAVQLEREATEE